MKKFLSVVVYSSAGWSLYSNNWRERFT